MFKVFKLMNTADPAIVKLSCSHYNEINLTFTTVNLRRIIFISQYFNILTTQLSMVP